MTLRPDPVRLAALALGALIAVWPIPAHAQPRAAGPRPDYRGTGVVEALLPPPSHLRGFRPGDRITFGLLDAPDALLVIFVERRR